MQALEQRCPAATSTNDEIHVDQIRCSVLHTRAPAQGTEPTVIQSTHKPQH